MDPGWPVGNRRLLCGLTHSLDHPHSYWEISQDRIDEIQHEKGVPFSRDVGTILSLCGMLRLIGVEMDEIPPDALNTNIFL